MPTDRIGPGARNLITDVDGIAVGNAEDARAISGVTVVLPDEPAVAGVDLRGGAPGTRETDALDPACLVDTVDAVVLSGGSVYGLDAAGGVVSWLAQRGRGYVLGESNVTAPIVPAAILFDLTNGGDKDWGDMPPYRALASAACDKATAEFELGNAGAGLGARAGQYKGGLGSASAVAADGLQVGAIVAANPFGSPVMPGTETLWAWAHEQNGELGNQQPPDPKALERSLDLPDDTKAGSYAEPGGNTAIGVVATNARLNPADARRIAIMAHDGYARAVRPIHTAVDGDVIFVVATGRHELPEPRPLSLSRVGTIAADCVARALARGVYQATTINGLQSYRDVFGL